MIFCTVAAGKAVSLAGTGNVELSIVGLMSEGCDLVALVLMRSLRAYLLVERGHRCLYAECQCCIHCRAVFTSEAVRPAGGVTDLRYLCLTCSLW
jgi:hypothetical protein